MTHADSTHRPPPQPRSRRVLRLILLAMMALCGAAMAALLLSDPMVTAKVKSTVETVTARFGGRTGSESVFDDAPPAISSLGDLEEMSATPLKIRSQVSVDEGATDDPVVKAAPVVRVRRAGVLVEG